MIITLTGTSFAIRRRLNDLTEKFVAKNGDFALEKFDAEEVEGQAVLEAVQSVPFLSPRKMVVVRNGAANKELNERVEQIISSSGKDTDLVFYEPSLDKRTSYFKVLKKQTEFENYEELDKYALAKWLASEAKNGGGELTPADASYLVERAGANQEMLKNELDKLLLYDPKITRDNIDLLVEPAPQSRVFDLLDAAFSGQKARALALYEDQRAQRVEPQAILAMLAWQLQLFTLAKLGKNRAPDQIAKDAGVSPYPLSKAAQAVKKISDEQLKRLVEGALEIDFKSKTTTYDLDEALKTYIATL